jgi:hypothetical protein
VHSAIIGIEPSTAAGRRISPMDAPSGCGWRRRSRKSQWPSHASSSTSFKQRSCHMPTYTMPAMRRAAEVDQRCGGSSSRSASSRWRVSRWRAKRRTKVVFPTPAGPTSRIEGFGSPSKSGRLSRKSSDSPMGAGSRWRDARSTRSSATEVATGQRRSGLSRSAASSDASERGDQGRTHSSPSRRKS